MRLRNVSNASEIMASSKLLVLDPKANKGKWCEVFGNNNPIHIEIGCGKGRYINDLASHYPNINFIGIEKFDNVIVRAIEKLEGVDEIKSNVRLIRIDATELAEVFSEKEISTIYLNFSDPWPKARHAKRRLTSKGFLDIYKVIAKDEIIMKTDNDDLFNYSLESLAENNFEVFDVTYDLHSLDEFNIMTEYEEKFSSKGVKIKRLKVKL